MERDALIFWRDKYDAEEDLYNKGEEEELRAKIQKNQYVTKENLKRIVEWKFQGRLEGRQKRILKLLKNVDGEYIIGLSKLAFKVRDDKTRVKLFCTINGIGTALASTILTFYDPEKYGVFDIHAWRELFGKESKSLFTDMKNVIKFIETLREISQKAKLPCREIEKALFKKNKTEADYHGNWKASK
jgi:hypothetical protein